MTRDVKLVYISSVREQLFTKMVTQFENLTVLDGFYRLFFHYNSTVG